MADERTEPGSHAQGRMILSADARTFSADHRIAHLATADRTGAPHVIPICYAVVGDAFYVVIDEKPKRSRTGLKRLRNIRDNAHVALVIDEYHDDWAHLAYLLVEGLAVVVQDEREFATALHALRERYPQYRSMPLAFATHPMIRITPQREHLWRATPR